MRAASRPWAAGLRHTLVAATPDRVQARQQAKILDHELPPL